MYEVSEKYKKIFKDDALGIAQWVIEFEHLISNDRHRKKGSSQVYSISANFGIGKTFFCEKLNDTLHNDGVKMPYLTFGSRIFMKTCLYLFWQN